MSSHVQRDPKVQLSTPWKSTSHNVAIFHWMILGPLGVGVWFDPFMIMCKGQDVHWKHFCENQNICYVMTYFVLEQGA